LEEKLLCQAERGGGSFIGAIEGPVGKRAQDNRGPAYRELPVPKKKKPRNILQVHVGRGGGINFPAGIAGKVCPLGHTASPQSTQFWDEARAHQKCCRSKERNGPRQPRMSGGGDRGTQNFLAELGSSQYITLPRQKTTPGRLQSSPLYVFVVARARGNADNYCLSKSVHVQVGIEFSFPGAIKEKCPWHGHKYKRDRV